MASLSALEEQGAVAVKEAVLWEYRIGLETPVVAVAGCVWCRRGVRAAPGVTKMTLQASGYCWGAANDSGETL